MQNQGVPSFLGVITIGKFHGLVDGRITPSATKQSTCCLTMLASMSDFLHSGKYISFSSSKYIRCSPNVVGSGVICGENLLIF